MLIPFNRSSLQGKELKYIHNTIDLGQVAGDQIYSRKCQQSLEKSLGVQKVLVTTSCTHALEMAAILLRICPGDEVIVPAFTFVSTANAFVLRGAKPVFCDIRRDTLNLDENKLEELITPKTRAIIPIHYAGVGCEMDAILKIAIKYSVPVVEDNAHGLFGKYKGKWLGSLGCLATLSFHETKNITCGEGGALIINNQQYINRAEIIREKGTNRAKFFRGQVDKYSWVDVGSSYVMSDVLAAFLFGQLEKRKTIQAKRKKIWQRYDTSLKDWAVKNGVRRPIIPPHCEQAYHMYYMLMPSSRDREKFIAKLRGIGISAVFHYIPLHQSLFAKKNKIGAFAAKRKSICPNSEDISKRIVRLPFFPAMTLGEQGLVIQEVKKIFRR